MAIPSTPLRLAAVQAEAVPGDVRANVATATRLAGRAGAAGAALAVFPELFVPAYHPPTLEAVPAACDVAADEERMVHDPRLDGLIRAADANRMTVVIGASVRHADGRRTISLLVIGGGRAVVGYDKQHLWGADEPRLFTPGTRGAAVNVGGWHLGLGICYDVSFPEHARRAALAGAHAYLCPSVFLIGRDHRRDLYFPTRALENTMYVVFVNGAGGAAPYRFSGCSAVFGPEGEPCARAAPSGEAVICADLDPATLQETRAKLPMLGQCRQAHRLDHPGCFTTAPVPASEHCPRSQPGRP
jgi:predicted amidohydrolase